MNFINRITENKTLLGLDCLLSGDGTVSCSAILLKKAGSKVVTEKVFESCNSLQALSSQMKDKPPVVLVINGKGIIHKHISWNESDDARTLLGKVLPNASLTDFYIQQSAPFNGKVLVSAARRSLIDQILDQCAEQKLDIIGCSLGPLIIESILPLLDTGGGYQYDFSFLEYSLSIVDNHLETFKTAQPFQDGTVKIGEENISFSTLLPFAAAFSALAGIPASHAEVDRVSTQREDNRQKRLFQFTLAGIVGFFLLVMLINFFAFDHFRSKKQHLEQQLSLNKDILQRLDTLTNEFHRKQGFLERTGMLQASRVSAYADDLCRGVPQSITLSGMNINPWQKPKADEDKVSFQKKTMRLSGFCNQSIELNDWMQEIKKKDWVKNIVLLNYSQTKGMQSGEFALQMDIK